jgi:hypothetical protein
MSTLSGRSENGFDKKANHDIVDTNPHTHAKAIALGLWEAPICTIRRSGFLGKFIRTFWEYFLLF